MEDLSKYWEKAKEQTIYSQIREKYCEFFMGFVNKNICEFKLQESPEITFCKFYDSPEEYATDDNIDLLAINATLKYFENREELKFFELKKEDSIDRMFSNHDHLKFYLTGRAPQRANLILNRLKNLWVDYNFGYVNQKYDLGYASLYYYFTISKKGMENNYDSYCQLFLQKDINNILKRITKGIINGFNKIHICEVYKNPERFKESSDYLAIEEAKNLDWDWRARMLTKKLNLQYPNFRFYYKKELERDYGCDGRRTDPDEYIYRLKADHCQIFMEEKNI